MKTVAARWIPGLGVGLALWMAAALPACAGNGTFRVRAHVPAPSEVTTGLLDAVPMPAGSTRLTRMDAMDSYWFAGSADAAAAHFHRAMPAQGYRLLHASEDARSLTWEGAQRRIEVRLQPVLGDGDATRILVEASPVS